MPTNLLYNQTREVPFISEVAFDYKKDTFKVHVNVLTEKDETIYKLYFKNNIDFTDKSLMKIFKEYDADGKSSWKCKAHYFSYVIDELAAIAGQAIDKVLLEQHNKALKL